MRLGIHLPQYGRAASPEAIRSVAMRAEALGVADVWVSDHIVQPADQKYPSPYLYEPLLSLAWAAAATERVGIGTSVLVVPQYHPLQLANSLASLDRMSAGRLTVVAGVGWSEAEFDALGQGFADRGARMDEAIDVMRTVWVDDPATFHGEHYSFDDLRVLPQPDRSIPIWIGGMSRPARRRAATRGDGFQAISTPADELAPVVAELRADRSGDDFVVSYRTGWDPQGMDAAQIRDECQAYAEAGVQHVVSAPWRTNVDDWIRSMELLVDIVEPEP
ncbi:MAG: LLM class F420-dependent oxidoreductase [Acidimicrobiaceae bacterium]|nr:LLM class F420-dependent oxidoreductase [Acidimicrobiaceae bacterium]